MHPLLERLKQRKIVQWALAYLAGAVAVYSALEAFAEPWGVGALQLRLTQVVLLVGFLLAVTLAWYHGERGEQKVSGVELMILAGIMGLGALGLRLVAIGPVPATQDRTPHVIRETLEGLGPSHSAGADFEIGPAGSGVIYRGSDRRIWYRAWGELSEGLIADGGGNRISPSGRHLALRDGDQLRVLPLDGGPSIVVADSAVGTYFSWDPDGTIYFSAAAGPGLSRVPMDGSEPPEALRLPATTDDASHGYIAPVPGTERVFVAIRGATARIESLDLATGESSIVGEGVHPEVTVTNHLVFATLDGEIMAAPIDPRSGRLTEPPRPVLSGVMVSGTIDYYRLANDGTLAYWTGGVGGLVWVTRHGAESPVDPAWSFDPGTGSMVWWSLSPDERRIAAVTYRGNADIWAYDLAQGTFGRLTAHSGVDRDPSWSPDGASLLFLSDSLRPSGQYDLWEIPADGAQGANLNTRIEIPVSEKLLAGDRLVVRTAPRDGFGRDLYVVDPTGEAAPEPLIATNADEMAPELSPNGRWLAYVSNASGADEVYVRPYPNVQSRRVQLSTGGGLSPVWSRDGSELFFLSGLDTDTPMMVAAQLDTVPELRLRNVVDLFPFRTDYRITRQSSFFDVDGEGRFLVYKTATEPDLIVVHNWFEELKRLVPN